MWILLGLALASIVLHVRSIDQFGWFRDELYYLACGAHLAWGYVDHPPLVALAAALIPGRSFLAARSIPILCGALALLLTWRLCERMGARGFGRVVAALATLFAPTYLFQFHTLSMNTFEILLWTSAALLAVDLDESAGWRRWAAWGTVIGVGLLNKHSMLFWTSALVAGWLLTGKAGIVRRRKPWLAALVAAVLVAPHVAWQVANGFPTLEFYRNAGANKILPMSPLGFVGAQLTLAGPGNACLWLLGLAWLLRARVARDFRFLGVAYLVLLLLFIIMHGKAYYLVPFYCVLFAAGGAALETWWSERPRAVLMALATALVVGLGAAAAPLAMPILSPDATIAWSRRLGLAPPQAERSALGDLPQHLADMFGWNALVDTLADIRDRLPETDRDTVQIVVGNYGEASAIDWLGPARGLPSARSPHNAYFMWGPPQETAGPVLVLGNRHWTEPRLHDLFAQVTIAGRTRCTHCMPDEHDLPIYLCRGWKQSPAQVWPRLKHYY
jgi:4-amino-4-deoxy-L-arabinose transferase-like glycosyltransferase